MFIRKEVQLTLHRLFNRTFEKYWDDDERESAPKGQ